MSGLNSKTISICGGNLGDFGELLQHSGLPKALALKNFAWESLLKLTIKEIDLFTDTAAILNSEEIMGYPGGRSKIIIKNTVA